MSYCSIAFLGVTVRTSCTLVSSAMGSSLRAGGWQSGLRGMWMWGLRSRCRRRRPSLHLLQGLPTKPGLTVACPLPLQTPPLIGDTPFSACALSLHNWAVSSRTAGAGPASPAAPSRPAQGLTHAQFEWQEGGGSVQGLSLSRARAAGQISPLDVSKLGGLLRKRPSAQPTCQTGTVPTLSSGPGSAPGMSPPHPQCL